jgi:hypothetical protein
VGLLDVAEMEADFGGRLYYLILMTEGFVNCLLQLSYSNVLFLAGFVASLLERTGLWHEPLSYAPIAALGPPSLVRVVPTLLWRRRLQLRLENIALHQVILLAAPDAWGLD